MNKIFELVDKDKSVGINNAEFEALQEVGMKISKRQSDLMLRQADIDGNGSIFARGVA